jgi:TRAP transporter TAXI family solute receptor
MNSKLLTAVCVFATVAAPALAAEKPFNLTVAGGSAAGILTTINSGVDKAVAKTFPGSTITYQTSGGGLANIALVQSKRVPLGYVTDAEITLAVEGRKPFKKKMDAIRIIAKVAGWIPMHYVVTKSFADKYKLKTFSDIAKVKPPIRMAVQQRGNVVSFVSEDMLKQIGVTPSDIKSWGGQVLYVSGAEFAPLMSDGRIDMMFNATGVRGRVATGISRAADVISLRINKAIVDKVAKKWGLTPFTIPKTAYKWQDFDLYTLSFGIVLIANKDMPDKTAYNLVKALVEQVDAVRKAHPFMRRLTKQFYTTNARGKYHPGAVRYYKEAGLMK